MQIPSKPLLLISGLALIAVGFFAGRALSRQNDILEKLHHQTAVLEAELQAVRTERDVLTRSLGSSQQSLEALRTKTANYVEVDPKIADALDAWLQNVFRLNQALEKMPASQIPELRYLTAKDWLDVTKDVSLDSELDQRRALNQLRNAGKHRFAELLQPALKRYLDANHGQPPASTSQLAPYFGTQIDPSLLQRYSLFTNLSSEELPFPLQEKDGSSQNWTVRETQSVDPYYDSTFQITSDTIAWGGRSQYYKEVDAAIEAFRAAHHNTAPSSPAELTPYLRSLIAPAFIQERLSQPRR